MIPECVNCKNLFTCTIKDKPKGEACVMFEERDKDKSEARKRFEEEMQGFSELTVEALKRWKRKNEQ
nr:MAG TPA: hypothetical protein [Bacteriophage sp.]